MGLVGCPWVIADEPGAWETIGGQLVHDAIETAKGKPGSPLRVVYIGTLAPAVGGWWHDLIADGSRGSTYVQACLAISLAIAAAEAGRRVYYGTLAGLIESLTEAKAAGNLSRRLRVLTHPALLVVDEIGYMPVNQDGAVLFFQIINARHDRASTVLTSNKGFEDWGGVLGDEVMAAALIDRLVHHCHIVNSYRMKDHQNLLKSGSDRRPGWTDLPYPSLETMNHASPALGIPLMGPDPSHLNLKFVA